MGSPLEGAGCGAGAPVGLGCALGGTSLRLDVGNRPFWGDFEGLRWRLSQAAGVGAPPVRWPSGVGASGGSGAVALWDNGGARCVGGSVFG